jgi:CBS domain-containing protein
MAVCAIRSWGRNPRASSNASLEEGFFEAASKYSNGPALPCSTFCTPRAGFVQPNALECGGKVAMHSGEYHLKEKLGMKVMDIMKDRVATCRMDTNLAQAAALMWQNDCGALPVISDEGELAGIITDRDMCIALGTRNMRASEISARDVAADYILACKPSDDVLAALNVMREGKVRRLPVLNDEARLVGILSMDDVVLNATPNGDKAAGGVTYSDAITVLKTIYGDSGESIGTLAATV